MSARELQNWDKLVEPKLKRLDEPEPIPDGYDGYDDDDEFGLPPSKFEMPDELYDEFGPPPDEFYDEFGPPPDEFYDEFYD